MISQAYIFGALGKAAFKQGEKWYLLDADAPDVVRDWHPFDNNYLSLSNSETTPVAANTDLEGIKRLLATETRKQEALTLALHLMDESIRDESLKAEIAELLGEYMEDAEIFQFLENRLLTTVVPDAFNPAFASNLCQSLQMQRIAAIYETLDTQSGDIHTFYSAWVKAAKNYFQDAGKADTAFHLLTAKGIAKTFVQGISERDKNLWDQAALNASLLFQQEKLASNALLFFTNLKTDLSHDFQIDFREKTIRESKDGNAKDDIEALIESYMEDYFDQKPSRKTGKTAVAKSAGARLEAVQANIEYTSNKMLESLREGNEGGARATLKALLRQQVQTSAPAHICKSLTKIAGYLLENGINTFSKTLLQYARLLNNNDPVVDTLYAEILKAEGNLKDAKEEYRRIKRIFPDNVVAQSGYAEILKAEGNLKEAKEEYKRIKSIFPDNVVAQTGYAEILKAEGNIHDAKQEYIRIKNNFPHNLVAQTGYAEILKAEGNIQDAKQEYIRIKNNFPNDVVAQTGFAEILKAEGNLKEAKVEYLRIKTIFPDNVVVQNGYAEILKSEGNLKEAKEEYFRIKTNFPNDVVVQNGYAEILKAEGNLKEAKKEYKGIKTNFPNDVVAQNGYAEILKAEGNLTEAKEEYRRIKNSFPNDIFAQNGYAEILKAEGNLKEAKDEYLRIKNNFPNDVVAQNGYAEILKAEGNLKQAKEEYLRIKNTFPNDVVVQNGYAEILKAEGNLKEAKEEYLRIKSKFPHNVVAQTGYAETLKAEGNLKEAKEEYLRIKSNFPDNVVAQTGYAEILKAEGNLKEAKEEYLRIKSNFPDNVVAQTGYANVLKSLGSLKEAQLEYRLILDYHPTDQIAFHALCSISLALDEPLDRIPQLPVQPKTENDFYWLQFHINKLLKQAEWAEAQKLVLLGLETCNFHQFKSLFKRTRKYIQIQIREFEAAIADYNEALENEPIDHLLRTHAFAELNQPALAQNELTKCLRFEEMQLVRQTAGFLSERYSIEANLPKSNLSIPELATRINFNEFALVSLAA